MQDFQLVLLTVSASSGVNVWNSNRVQDSMTFSVFDYCKREGCKMVVKHPLFWQVPAGWSSTATGEDVFPLSRACIMEECNLKNLAKNFWTVKSAVNGGLSEQRYS